VPPFHIYCWTPGFGLSRHDVALKFGHRDVYDLLAHRSPPQVGFINTVLAGDEAGARALIEQDPSLLTSLTPADQSRLAHAVFDGRREAAHLMIQVPRRPGGSAPASRDAGVWRSSGLVSSRLSYHRGLPCPAFSSSKTIWISQS
jgi:hypothetical protein